MSREPQLQANIRAVEYFLPSTRLSNEELVRDFPDRTAEELGAKTGVHSRAIASKDQCASDLGCEAAERLFAAGSCAPGDIDFLLLCTQSPDYLVPTTACLLQQRLGLHRTAGALDINLGCSGFVYGLSLAKGLIETGQARKVLFITADTFSKYLRREDRSTRALFGDGAAATLIEACEPDSQDGDAALGPFVFGTDGSGAEHLILRNSALRDYALNGDDPAGPHHLGLHMNGPEVFAFSFHNVPVMVKELLRRARLAMEDVDLFIFHQASLYILDRLQQVLRLTREKCYVSMADCGNTISSTIPIALKRALLDGRAAPGMRVALVGFGVGYSWGATLVRLAA